MYTMVLVASLPLDPQVFPSSDPHKPELLRKDRAVTLSCVAKDGSFPDKRLEETFRNCSEAKSTNAVETPPEKLLNDPSKSVRKVKLLSVGREPLRLLEETFSSARLRQVWMAPGILPEKLRISMNP